MASAGRALGGHVWAEAMWNRVSVALGWQVPTGSARSGGRDAEQIGPLGPGTWRSLRDLLGRVGKLQLGDAEPRLEAACSREGNCSRRREGVEVIDVLRASRGPSRFLGGSKGPPRPTRKAGVSGLERETLVPASSKPAGFQNESGIGRQQPYVPAQTTRPGSEPQSKPLGKTQPEKFQILYKFLPVPHPT